MIHQLPVNHGRHPVGAVPQTERRLQLHLILQMILADQLLKHMNDVVRPFQMAGTANANVNIHSESSHEQFAALPRQIVKLS